MFLVIIAIAFEVTIAQGGFNVTLLDGAKPLTFFIFDSTGVYNCDFNLEASIAAAYDPDGRILKNILMMQFLYVRITNPLGGCDYLPFTKNKLQITRKSWSLWAGTELSVAYSIDKELTEYFRPGFLETIQHASLRLINRVVVRLTSL